MIAFRRWVVVVLASLGVFFFASSAEAQWARTWVSGVGDDLSTCTRTAPCRTFAAALAKTPTNGEIDVLDDGAFGVAVITKGVTIDGHGKIAAIYNGGGDGIIINAPKTESVTIRGLSIGGGGNGQKGISVLQASRVSIEDSVIFGQATGISVAPVATSALVVNIRNTVLRGNTSAGLAVGDAAGLASVLVEGSSIQGGTIGAHVGASATFVAVRTLFSGQTGTAFDASAGASAFLTSCTVSGSNTGISSSSGATVRLSDNDVVGNFTAISGATVSFGNNRIAGNQALGNPPTPIGTDAPAKGQQ